MSSVSGIGSKQRYVGVPISLDKPEPEVIEKVAFECHRCGQMVDSEKGFYVSHNRLKPDRFGGVKSILCAASNNKVKAELRSVTFSGKCDQCNIDMEITATEEYPGGLKKYGGLTEGPCVVCDGKTHASCDQPDCGELLTEVDGTWVHTKSGLDDCSNSASQWYVLDMDQPTPASPATSLSSITPPAPPYVQIAGPFASEADAYQEQGNRLNAPTATGNENYEVAELQKYPTKASPFAPTIKSNPVNIVQLHDGFTIEELDD